MCSRENQSTQLLFSPSLAVLTPLLTANRTLRANLESSTAHLRALATTFATPNTRAACEAACIEALAVAGAAVWGRGSGWGAEGAGTRGLRLCWRRRGAWSRRGC
ncbi:hypothetical protein PSPO01_04193 [Paraphaeosphaeria sporulosa]